MHAVVYCKLCFVGVAIRLEFQFGPHVSGVQLNPQLEVNNKKRGLERGVQYWKKSRFFVRSASNFLDQIVFFTKYKKRKKVEVGQHQLLLPVLFPFYSKLEILIGFLLLSPLSRLLLNHKFSQIGFSISTTLCRKKSIWVQFGQRFISCVVRGDGGVGRLQGSRGFTRFRNCCLNFPQNKARNAMQVWFDFFSF